MIDVERAQTFEVRGQPHQKPGVILSLFRCPYDFGKGAHAGEGHATIRPQLQVAEHVA